MAVAEAAVTRDCWHQNMTSKDVTESSWKHGPKYTKGVINSVGAADTIN